MLNKALLGTKKFYKGSRANVVQYGSTLIEASLMIVTEMKEARIQT